MAAESPKKQTQFKPNQSQSPKSQNEYKLNYNKGLQKKRRFRSPNKQTQFKPNFRKTKMNLKSLAGKSGHNLHKQVETVAFSK